LNDCWVCDELIKKLFLLKIITNASVWVWERQEFKNTTVKHYNAFSGWSTFSPMIDKFILTSFMIQIKFIEKTLFVWQIDYSQLVFRIKRFRQKNWLFFWLGFCIIITEAERETLLVFKKTQFLIKETSFWFGSR